MITTKDGKPIEFIITPASTADITAFKLMEIDLPTDASIYGDKAYTQYSLEDDLQEFEKIRLIADRKTDEGKATFRLFAISAKRFKKKNRNYL